MNVWLPRWTCCASLIKICCICWGAREGGSRGEVQYWTFILINDTETRLRLLHYTAFLSLSERHDSFVITHKHTHTHRSSFRLYSILFAQLLLSGAAKAYNILQRLWGSMFALGLQENMPNNVYIYREKGWGARARPIKCK